MNHVIRPVLAASLSVTFLAGSLFTMASAASLMPWRKDTMPQQQSPMMADKSQMSSSAPNPPVSDMRPMGSPPMIGGMDMQDHDDDGLPGHMEALTPEQKKAWMAQKAKWAKMTPAERKLATEAKRAQMQAKLNAMTPEQRQQFAQKLQAHQQARLNAMTPEQRERFMDKKAKWEAMTPDQRAQKMADHKAKWEAMTPDQRKMKQMSHDNQFMPPSLAPGEMSPEGMSSMSPNPSLPSANSDPNPMAMPK